MNTTTLTWSEYCKLAARTESTPENYFGKLAHIPDPVKANDKATRLLHAAMGLVTETQELSDWENAVNIQEELGDCYWYLAIVQNVFPYMNLTPMHTRSENFTEALAIMKHWAAEILDQLKRHIFYGTAIEEAKFTATINAYTNVLFDACLYASVKEEQAWEANILKLEKRYPKLRFDESDAVNRDTVNELSHIEAPKPSPELLAKLSGGAGSGVDNALDDRDLEILLAMETMPSNPPIGSQEAALLELNNINPESGAMMKVEFKATLLTEVDYVKLPQLISSWASTIAADYRDRGCNALADGFKSVYRSVLENWSPTHPEKVLEDAWELYVHMVENDLPNGSLYLEEFKKWVRE